jgi:hypothetical protein
MFEDVTLCGLSLQLKARVSNKLLCHVAYKVELATQCVTIGTSGCKLTPSSLRRFCLLKELVWGKVRTLQVLQHIISKKWFYKNKTIFTHKILFFTYLSKLLERFFLDSFSVVDRNPGWLMYSQKFFLENTKMLKMKQISSKINQNCAIQMFGP